MKARKRNGKPLFLFIPTASNDDERYWQFMKKLYEKLECQANVLKLIAEKPNAAQIRKAIAEADIIYVGGGNTLKMMRLWRRLGVDKLLKKAWRAGTVMCGLSAGSICWYESGHSDSMSYTNPKKWKYINVKGLGFIKGIHCPHYDSETLGVKRKDNFKAMMKKTGGMGIAVDDRCAIAYEDSGTRVLRAIKSANAYRVWRAGGKVVEERL